MTVPDGLIVALARDFRELDKALVSIPELADFRARYWPAAREIIALADQIEPRGV